MRKNYCWVILLGILLVAGGPARAQLLGYQFQAQAGTYLPLGTGATRLPDLEADEAVVNGVPLGFSFVMNGQFFTKAGVSSNGWLSLAPTPVQFAIPYSTSLYLGGAGSGRTIAPLWADLSGSGGRAFYQTTGTAPNRVFTMEWRDFRWDKQATQAVVSFQARLYEGSNRIEFSYRPEAGSVSSSTPMAQARAGLTTGPYSSTVNYIMLSDLGASPQLNPSNYEGTLLKPAGGQLYRFTPSPNTIPDCPVATSPQLRRLTHTTATVDWVLDRTLDVGRRVHYGPRGFVLGSAADKVAPVLPGDTAQLTGLLPSTDYEFLVEVDCGTSTALTRSTRGRFRTYTPPSNDEGSRAIWVPVLGSVRYTQLTGGRCADASTSLPATAACGTPTEIVRDVWYAFRATEASHQLVMQGYTAQEPYVVDVRDGYGPSSRSLFCGLNTAAAPLVVGSLAVGQPYFIRIYPLRPEHYSFQLAVLGHNTTPPANDNCTTAQVLPVDPVPGSQPGTTGTVRHATASNLGLFGTGSCSASTTDNSRDVFYQFVAPGPAAEVQLRPAFTAGVDVLSSCTSVLPSYRDCITVEAGKLGRLALTGLTTGATYYLRVYNASEVVDLIDAAFAIAVSAPPGIPINDECAGAVVLPVTAPLVVGATGTFNGATASGLAPPATLCYAPRSNTNPYTAPAAASDVWYRFTATSTTHALQLHATSDAVLEVLRTTAGSPCAPGAPVQRLACAVAHAEDPLYGRFYVGEKPPLPARLLLTSLSVGETYWVRAFPLAAPTATRPAGKYSFELSLNTWAAPANDEPAAAVPVAVSPTAQPCASPVAFTLDGATPSFPAAGGSAWTERDVWFSFVAPPATGGRSYSSVLLWLGENQLHMMQGGIELRDGTTRAARILESQQWGPFAQLVGPGLSYNRLTPGQTYYVRFYSSLTNPEPLTQFSFCLTVALNDEPCDALPLPLSASGQCTQPVVGTLFGATPSRINPGLGLAVPNCSAETVYDVWYRVVPTSSAFFLRTDDVTVGQARLYKLATPGGACAEALELVSCQASQAVTVEPRALGTVLFDNLTPGQPYYLAVANQGGAGDNRKVSFTLCAQSAVSLPTRGAAGRAAGSAWPNPVAAGEALHLRLPADLPRPAAVRAQWLTAQGQELPGAAAAQYAPVAGELALPTTGRAPGLYLLRLWLPDGQPLPVYRVVVQ
ncbi:hypothetical protein [Hymenobacter metallicola]|uniref:T9SS-like galactose binding domain-containing protein n=1 Tax=Hymenobacter metallicola TaxID=2563114 RepID=A0A4Z0Q1J4_9BACT|nr:hypothetical protein [Hymenobacter metallicola]TGE23043.1 hypothetical protein E5K02_22070 [Hymenobacter metallicola]